MFSETWGHWNPHKAYLWLSFTVICRRTLGVGGESLGAIVLSVLWMQGRETQRLRSEGTTTRLQKQCANG